MLLVVYSTIATWAAYRSEEFEHAMQVRVVQTSDAYRMALGCSNSPRRPTCGFPGRMWWHIVYSLFPPITILFGTCRLWRRRARPSVCLVVVSM